MKNPQQVQIEPSQIHGVDYADPNIGFPSVCISREHWRGHNRGNLRKACSNAEPGAERPMTARSQGLMR
jgi:hypothetical protein